ncbi:hypothetical protein NN561_017165 [Cricetulus griseus]
MATRTRPLRGGTRACGPRERIRESPGVAAPTSFRVPTGVRRGKAPPARATGAAEVQQGPRLPRARPTTRDEESPRESRGLSLPHLAGGRLRGGEREGAPGGGQQPRSLEFVFAFSPQRRG